jgi:hypothetical protein
LLLVGARSVRICHKYAVRVPRGAEQAPDACDGGDVLARDGIVVWVIALVQVVLLTAISVSA